MFLTSKYFAGLLGELIHLAHFSARQISEWSTHVENFILYELRTFS